MRLFVHLDCFSWGLRVVSTYPHVCLLTNIMVPPQQLHLIRGLTDMFFSGLIMIISYEVDQKLPRRLETTDKDIMLHHSKIKGALCNFTRHKLFCYITDTLKVVSSRQGTTS